jgi:hypothetical protein
VEGAPIDLAILGLGRDGHVAFDEPPARVASGVRAVALAAPTRQDAAPAFGGIDHVPDRALTVGLGTLYASLREQARRSLLDQGFSSISGGQRRRPLSKRPIGESRLGESRQTVAARSSSSTIVPSRPAR